VQTKKPNFIIRIFLYLAFLTSFGLLAYFGTSSLFWLLEKYFETQFSTTKIGVLLSYLIYLLPWLVILSVFAVPLLAALALKYFVDEKELYLNSMYKAIKEVVNFFWYRGLLIINAFKKTS